MLDLIYGCIFGFPCFRLFFSPWFINNPDTGTQKTVQESKA